MRPVRAWKPSWRSACSRICSAPASSPPIIRCATRSAPAPILAGLGPGQRYGLPWFEHRDAIFLWREGPASEPSPWGVAQPPATAAALVPDVVLVPIVLADRTGVRIGHGKGHYDRALANLKQSGRPVTTIGLCWPDQLVDGPLPIDPWDTRLDSVATPGEWVTCA